MGAIVTRMFQDIATANDISFLVMSPCQITDDYHLSFVRLEFFVSCQETAAEKLRIFLSYSE